jgi:hypothetical protein
MCITCNENKGWRTLLVVPELKRELRIWKEVQPLYQRLLKLELLKSEMYRDMDYEAVHPPVMSLPSFILLNVNAPIKK